MTSIVSAVFGGYDTVRAPLPQSVPTTFTLLTDEWPVEPQGWDVVVPKKIDVRHPRTVAKEPKLRPWNYSRGDGPWIWLDASFEIISPLFVAEVLEAAGDAAIAQWRHPWRTCVYDEATASAELLKYRDVPVLEQAAHYRSAVEHPVHWGLWATGLIVYRDRQDYLADHWWAEMRRWGYQDQISQPVALKATGLRPRALEYELHRNPWVKWHPHRDES